MASQAATASARFGNPQSKRAPARARVLRPALMLLGVAAFAVAAGAYWLRAGGTVTVDDATIDAAHLAVSTDVSGIVAQVAVHEGDRVARGQVLLRLDDTPFRIAVAGDQAALRAALLDADATRQEYRRAEASAAAAAAQVQADAADYARFAAIAHTGAVTGEETDNARFRLAADRQRLGAMQADAGTLLARLLDDPAIDPNRLPAVQQARARLAEAQRELDHTVVRAPFPGIVTEVDQVQPGLYLAAATPALALVSDSDIWAEGEPKETALTHVAPGDRVTVHVDSYPGRHWTGTVASIAPAAASEFSVLPAQNTSGNWVKVVQRIPVRVALDPVPGAPALRAGMSVSLDIRTGHRRRLSDLVP
jgi:membrane fusion protein (multidrug efflux system)